MSTRIWLLRHAESADPTVFHGAESDVDLSERGVRQANALVPALAAHVPTAIVSSAMRRARRTAEPLARHCGLALQIEPDLHERRVGALSGTPFAAADGPWPRTLVRWIAGETHYAPDGAESFDQIRARVLPVWERIARQHAGGRVVVVAHGLVCKVILLSCVPGWSVSDWKTLGPIHNAGVSELRQTAESWELLGCNIVPREVEWEK